jgi:hypothetical protein
MVRNDALIGKWTITVWRDIAHEGAVKSGVDAEGLALSKHSHRGRYMYNIAGEVWMVWILARSLQLRACGCMLAMLLLSPLECFVVPDGALRLLNALLAVNWVHSAASTSYDGMWPRFLANSSVDLGFPLTRLAW